MTDFLGGGPTPDTNWRAVVLFGRNVASYKFALAKMLLELAGRANDRMPLLELAAPFARHLCEHLHQVDKQTTSASSKFLDSCRAFNKGELAEDRLIESTARLGFNNVFDAFRVVGVGLVPTRFFIDERKTSQDGGAIRLTDNLHSLAASLQDAALSEETELRWRLVETAWALDLPRAGLAVQADDETNMLFVERVRRVNLTGVYHRRGRIAPLVERNANPGETRIRTSTRETIMYQIIEIATAKITVDDLPIHAHAMHARRCFTGNSPELIALYNILRA